MGDFVALGKSKVGLVTGEDDPMDPRTRSECALPGLRGKQGEGHHSSVYYEAPEQLNSQSWTAEPKSIFEIEPGHFDFLACSSVTSSKPYSTDSGSGKHSSGTTGSSTVYSTSSHSSPGAATTTTTTTNSNHAPSAFLKNRRVREAHQSEADARNHPDILQPLLKNFTWRDVEEIIERARVEKEQEHKDGKGSSGVFLGRGGFGKVFMGIVVDSRRRRNGAERKVVAVKILGADKEQGNAEFLNEVHLLSSINHINLVKLLGYCQEGSHRALVYEYAEQGSIGDHLHGTGIVLDWSKRIKICLDSAYGLEYLHTGCNPRIVHRDIKSSNILLTKDWVAKVADFGLSKMRSEDDSRSQPQLSTRVKGTPGYLDPAYFMTGRMDEMIDIYSFGVLLLEMITGRKPNNPTAPFIGDWVKKQCGSLKVIADPKLGGRYNSKSMKEVLHLALKCIAESPSDRPDMKKVALVLRVAVEMENNPSTASKWTLKSLIGLT